MTDYPQHIVAEACRIASQQRANGTANWKPYEHARSATIQAICRALIMDKPEPPKDVLVGALQRMNWGPTSVNLAAHLHTELACLGHEVAPIRQPVSEEVIEREAEAIYLDWIKDRIMGNHSKLAAAAIRRGIELAGEWMTTPDAREIAGKLTKAQREAVLHCGAEGNGAHIWSIYPLVRMGLMSLVPVPALQGIPAYRLNVDGLEVRAILEQSHD